MPELCSGCSQPAFAGVCVCPTCPRSEEDAIVDDAVARLDVRPTGSSELRRELDFQLGQLVQAGGSLAGSRLARALVAEEVRKVVSHVSEVVQRMWPGLSVSPFNTVDDIKKSPTERGYIVQVCYCEAPLRNRRWLYYQVEVAD